MVLKFGTWGENDQQSIMVCKTKFRNGYYRVYNVYFDDKIIGTTLGAADKIIVITFEDYGPYVFDEFELADKMRHHMDMTSLLAIGSRV